MLTLIIVVLLVLVTVSYAVIPLLAPRQVDALPDDRDPVTVDLEEERDALLRAIRELDGRDDLKGDRRDRLRARYEAKAAQVLRGLEERKAERGGEPVVTTPVGRRKPPWAMLGLLGLAVAATASLGAFVLPRVGQGTVTTFFADDLRAAEALRDLQRAAERDASVSNLMALADAYWTLEDAEGAERSYRQVLTVASPTASAPALAYKRLALLVLEGDLAAARDLLIEARRVDPLDPETLFALGELNFALGDLGASSEAFRAYLATPEGVNDLDALARTELVEALAPVSSAVVEERSAQNLLALADVFWLAGAQDPAVELYFEVLSNFDAFEPTALSRTGQLLFVRGRTEDAAAVLERAAVAAGGLALLEPQASLFLGNAYAVMGDDVGAVRAWEAYVQSVGQAAAGRVPELLAAARIRAAGGEAPLDGGTTTPPVDLTEIDEEPADDGGVDDGGIPSAEAAEEEPVGQELSGDDLARAAMDDPALFLQVGEGLYRAYCAVCHGAEGDGGAGPRLRGNARANQPTNVRSLIRFGRGMMPGFGAQLSETEIELLLRWVGQELATTR